MMVMTRKPSRRKHAAGLIQIRRPIDLRFKLSASGVRDARAFLDAALAVGRSGSSQLRLDTRDLDSIYIYLAPAQMKKLAARLAALELNEP